MVNLVVALVLVVLAALPQLAQADQAPTSVMKVPPAGETQELLLKDGTRAIGRVETTTDDGFTFRTTSGAAIEVDVSQIGGGASAQTATPARRKVFVEAALLRSKDEEISLFGSDSPFTVWGASISAGIPIGSRYGLRIEAEVPQRHVEPPSGRTYYGHPEATRNPTLAVMLARHFGERQLIAVMAGVCAIRHDVDILGLPELSINGIPLGDLFSNPSTTYLTGLSLGGDVTVPLTQRLALVPQFRFHHDLAITQVALRIRIALRWQF